MGFLNNDLFNKREIWSTYWRKFSQKKGLYVIFANFYRNFIISWAVRFYFRKYFKDKEDSMYLHAGCGSGDSDRRIGFRQASFVYIDLNFEALNIAKAKTKFKNIYFVCADILHLPFKPRLFDGIWNLGVMEHFYENEIVTILKEFEYILRDRGIYMLFWPPQYGLTVIVMSIFQFIMSNIFKKKFSFYPDDVSNYRTINWANKLAKESGLFILKTHFNIRDIFTHRVLVGSK